MIGERLYAIIQGYEPNLAGKITGMLLEQNEKDLLILINNPDLLCNKIGEAITVLEKAKRPNTVDLAAVEGAGATQSVGGSVINENVNYSLVAQDN